MQQPPAGSDGRGRVMCYVPGEICVVVATNGSAGDGLYESVRQEMNRVVPAAHGRIDGAAGGDFAPDLAFADLQRHMQARGTGDLLVRPDLHGLDVSGPDPSKLDPADRELLQSATLLHAIPDPVVELPPLA